MSARAAEPLDRRVLWAALPASAQERIARLDLVESIESTNSELIQRPIPASGTTEVLTADYQTAGRGRLGRRWLASPGGAICLSLSWAFPQIPRDLSALSLAMGVCVLRALRAQGARNVQLKWPNDILLRDSKLGGILIELRRESNGTVGVVIGIGLNMTLDRELAEQLMGSGIAATDLVSAGYASISRNALAASLIESCLAGLIEFQREGLLPFIESWREADALHGKPVSATSMGESAQGIARGIDLSGALVLETPHGLKKFSSADVTLRLVV